MLFLIALGIISLAVLYAIYLDRKDTREFVQNELLSNGYPDGIFPDQ